MNTDTLSAAGWAARLGDAQELSPAEKAALADFLRESPLHVRELIEHTFIREDLKALPVSRQQLDRWVAGARAAVAGTAAESIDPRPNLFPARPAYGRRTGSARRHSRKYLIAASLAGVLFALGSLFVHSQLGLYTTGFGEQRILMLADGSVVTLNTESQMRVTFSDHVRSIALLKGEALFHVAHDTQRPFLVSAADTTVRAVGTQFNVRMTREDTVVSVIDGVIRVTDNEEPRASDEDAQVTLTKGEEARIARHRHAEPDIPAPTINKIETQAALHAASWTQGRVEFASTPLAEVLSELQRYRQFDVEIDEDATRQLKLTGSFESHDPDSLLDYLATLPGMSVEKTGSHSYRIHHR